MDPTFQTFVTTWDIRPEVVFVQLVFGFLYIMGWLRLRRKGAKLANGWRMVSYLSAQALFSIALMSGVDVYQYFLFFIHMIQHFLLIMFVPVLLFWSKPLPIIFWGLPHGARRQVGQLLGKKGPGRRILNELSTPGTVWLVFTCVLWLWHDPNAYSAATENEFIHDLEHIGFFTGGMLLWWQITGSAPLVQKKRSYVVRLIMVGLAYFQNLILGIGISMYGKPIYPHYQNVPRMWGISVISDQTAGGLIMWLPGGMMYLIAALVLIGYMIQDSERQANMKHKKRPDPQKVLFSSWEDQR
jgi:putative membrane protein